MVRAPQGPWRVVPVMMPITWALLKVRSSLGQESWFSLTGQVSVHRCRDLGLELYWRVGVRCTLCYTHCAKTDSARTLALGFSRRGILVPCGLLGASHCLVLGCELFIPASALRIPIIGGENETAASPGQRITSGNMRSFLR